MNNSWRKIETFKNIENIVLQILKLPKNIAVLMKKFVVLQDFLQGLKTLFDGIAHNKRMTLNGRFWGQLLWVIFPS